LFFDKNSNGKKEVLQTRKKKRLSTGKRLIQKNSKKRMKRNEKTGFVIAVSADVLVSPKSLSYAG